MSGDEIVGDRPKRVKMEAVTEDHVTPECSKVTPDSELSVANCPIKLENVDVTTNEENSLHADHDAQPEASRESPPAIAVRPTKKKSPAGRSERKRIDGSHDAVTRRRVTSSFGLPVGWTMELRQHSDRKRVVFIDPNKNRYR